MSALGEASEWHIYSTRFLSSTSCDPATEVALDALVAGADWQLHVSALIAAGFAVNVFILTPRINDYRDRDLEGDATAKRMFGLLHLASVGIFLLQLAGSLAVIGFYSLGSAA